MTSTKQPHPSDLTLREMLEALAQPLPAHLIKTKNTGDYQAEYVNVTDLKDLADQRIGSGSWETFIEEAFQASEQFILIVKITVTGSDGKSCSHIGTGFEFIEDIKYGDTSSNAYAMGIKRCFESFGLGRQLWRKEPDHSGSNTREKKAFTGSPLAKSVSELATPKQIVMIRAVCRDLDIDVDIELAEVMKLDCKVEELSRKGASCFIDHLKMLQEGTEIPIVRRAPSNVKEFPAPKPIVVGSPLVLATELQLDEIIIGFDEMKLNQGQRKTYIMGALNLKAAPPMARLTDQQASEILNKLRTDLRG